MLEWQATAGDKDFCKRPQALLGPALSYKRQVAAWAIYIITNL
jgi:hypothetical protein